jgi:predicted permease
MTRWNGRRTSGYAVLSNPLWEQFRDTQTTFDGVLAWANTDLRVGRDAGRRTVRGLFVSGTFFHVLGVQPARGRLFAGPDDRPGCRHDVAVVSDGFWRRELGGDASVIGRTIAVNDRPLEIVGVTPAGFTGVEVGRAYDVAVPICSQAALGREASWLTDGSTWWLTVMGRMRQDQTLAAANAELRAASPALFDATVPSGASAEETSDYRSLALQAVAGGAGVSATRTAFGDPLLVLLLIAALLLLLVCTNLASLVLSRAATRQPEFAVRMALGASAGDVVRQVALENLFVALGGALIGLALCSVFSQLLLGMLGPDLAIDVRLDPPVVGFVLLSAALSCLVFGVAPAWRAARSAASAIAGVASARGTAATASGNRVRQGLVTLQVAVSLVLVSGAFLFGGTLRHLLAVDSGFRHEGVTVARVEFDDAAAPLPVRATQRRTALERIRQAPGVLAAAEARHVPLSGTGTSLSVWRDGADRSGRTAVRLNGVSDGYFDTMGIRMTAGRDFSDRDLPSSLRVAIVNTEFVRRLGIAGNPIGSQFRVDDGEQTAVEIVGVVPDTKHFTLREDFLPIAFVPMTQIADPRPFTDFAIRSTSATVAADLRGALGALGASGIDVRTLESGIQRALVRERLLAILSGFFGLLAVAIAVVGVYGTVLEFVSRRKAEIGLRMALGASKRDIMSMVFRRVGVLMTCGLALGALLVAAAADSVRTLVFGVQPLDLASIGYACAVLAGSAAVATFRPVYRAAGLPPLAALRDS